MKQRGPPLLCTSRLMDLTLATFAKTTKDCVVRPSEKRKKRRRRGILFSSRSQLEKARMGRRKANISVADISDTAKELSFTSMERSSDDAILNILEKDGDSIVRVL